MGGGTGKDGEPRGAPVPVYLALPAALAAPHGRRTVLSMNRGLTTPCGW
jgi:hypothetical protein